MKYRCGKCKKVRETKTACECGCRVLLQEIEPGTPGEVRSVRIMEILGANSAMAIDDNGEGYILIGDDGLRGVAIGDTGTITMTASEKSSTGAMWKFAR